MDGEEKKQKNKNLGEQSELTWIRSVHGCYLQWEGPANQHGEGGRRV